MKKMYAKDDKLFWLHYVARIDTHLIFDCGYSKYFLKIYDVVDSNISYLSFHNIFERSTSLYDATKVLRKTSSFF